jgi:ribosome-binding protein aMBF1 (putative translation factor)
MNQDNDGWIEVKTKKRERNPQTESFKPVEKHYEPGTVSWNKKGIRQTNESKKDFIKREEQAGRHVSKAVNRTEPINKSGSSGLYDLAMSAKKLENETETFVHKTVSMAMAKKIAKLRIDAKLTQKDLAFKLNLHANVIRDYENGTSIPKANIINKIENVLGSRVRD